MSCSHHHSNATSDHSTVRAKQKLNCFHNFSSLLWKSISPFDLQSRAPSGIKSLCLTAGKNEHLSEVTCCSFYVQKCEGFLCSGDDLTFKTKSHCSHQYRIMGAYSVLIHVSLFYLPHWFLCWSVAVIVGVYSHCKYQSQTLCSDILLNSQWEAQIQHKSNNQFEHYGDEQGKRDVRY